MTTAEQPPPEGDEQPPQAASVEEPESGSGTRDADPEDQDAGTDD